MRLRVSTRLKLETIITTMLAVPCKMKSFRRAQRASGHLSNHATREAGPGYKLRSLNKAKKVSFSCTFKNIEKEFKGGIIACTQRAGFLVV